MKEALRVILWEMEVGRLAWDRKRKRAYFIYNPVFLAGKWDIAPLAASIKDVRSSMPIWGDDDRKFQKLPPFLADSLPDDWGNQLFECWRTENKLSIADITPLEKLSFIGKRGMGALEFIPETSHKGTKDKIDVQSLVQLAQRIFSERENARIRPDESLTLQSLIAVGTSAGGRQPKAVVAIQPQTGEIRSGQISGLKGYDYCILKFGDTERSSAELEMAYYKMACRAGIRMMESRLIEVERQQHFLTKRFDRDGDKKLHIQTLAALYPDADSYEKLLWVCRKINIPEADCEEVFRRMVFNILANNTDDHNKNFAFIMNQEGDWRLSPAYDMTFIFNTGGYQPQNERCLMIRGKLNNITLQDVIDFASDNGIQKPESIIHDVAKAIATFRELAVQYKVKKEWANRIDSVLSERLVEWGILHSTQSVQQYSFVHAKYKIDNAKIEQAYRGNYHLLATINERELKYIIRKGTEEYEQINNKGIKNISEKNFIN